MDTLRKISLWLCGILLGPFVLLGVAALAFTQTIGNPEYLKQTLAEATIYEAIGKQIRVQSSKEISAKDEARVNKALAAATTSQNMQQVTEGSIDQVFKFLNGERQAEELSIDITPITKKLNGELGKQIEEQLDIEIKKCKKLQRSGAAVDCSELQVQKKDVDKLVDEAFGKDGVLADGNLTLGDIEQLSGNEKNPQNPSLADTLQLLASLYQLARIGIVICSVLALGCIAGIILLSLDRLRGVRRVGSILLINGALLVVTSVVGIFLSQKGAGAFTNPSENLTNAVGVAGSKVVTDFALYNRNLGIIILVIGIITTAISWILIKKHTPKTPEASEKPKPTDTPKVSTT